jgi:hypothetical protein
MERAGGLSRIRSIGLLVGVAALLSPFATTASGALEIHYRKQRSSSDAGQQTLHTSPHCQPGESIASGGAVAEEAGMALNSTFPAQSLNHWRVYYDNHNDVDVDVTTYAICVNKASRSTTKTVTSTGRQFGTARCPRGDVQPTGGGVFSAGGFGTTYIVSQGVETREPDGWNRGRWHSVTRGYQLTSELTITAHAVCVGVDPRYPTANGEQLAPGNRKGLTSRCRVSERVIGGGGGPLSFTDVPSAPAYIAGSYPVDTATDLDRIPDNGWRMYFENPPESSVAPTLRTFAICVDA